MKVNEILPEEQLDENAWRKAIAAGAVGATLAGAPKTGHDTEMSRAEPPRSEVTTTAQRGFTPEFDFEPDIPQPKEQLRQSQLTTKIAKHYRVNRELVADVVDLAFEYQDPVFPRAEDILAVIGVESSFNPDSISGLRRDPAIGLMQVRPGIWNIDPDHLADLENQIKYGVKILKKYHRRLKDPEAALHAYNLGITRFRRGDRNPRYVDKVQQVKDFVGGI